MSQIKKSIGSLAAIAALVANHQTSAITNISPIVNQDASLSADVDGDGTDDFWLNSGLLLEPAGVIQNTATFDGSTLFTFFEGDVINSSWPFQTFADLSSIVGSGPTYIGIRFDRSGSTHLGYLLIDLPTNLPEEGTIIGGGWESDPGDGVLIVAVPEPGHVALFGGALALAVAAVRRRRRS
jgi:hypothetical protein